MSLQKSIPLVLFLLPFFLFFASEEEHHEANPVEFIGKVVNFFILFGGLTYLLYKPVRKFLEGRSKEISHSIQESRESRQDAEMRFQEANKRLQELGVEINRIKETSESEGKERRERILDSAKSQADHLKKTTQQEIEMLSQESVRQLREHVITLAVEIAREKIQQGMTPAVHSKLIDKSIEKFEELNEE